MGCFDEVLVPCPRCKEIYTCQSKGGYCNFTSYSLDEAPQDVLSDVNRHAPFTCENCGCIFKVKTIVHAYAEIEGEQNFE